MNLFENNGLVTLYRGDNNFVQRFEMSKTDSDALLGIGFYLTTDPTIAADYTIKGTDKASVAYRHGHGSNRDNPPTSEKELISDYLHHLMVEAGSKEALGQQLDEWRQKADREAAQVDWSDHDRARQERQAIYDRVRQEYALARSKLIRQLVEKAKAQFVKERPNLRIVRMTTGEYIFTTKNRAGSVAHFEVPAEYLARCLHAERPLSDDVLAIIKTAFLRAFGDDKELDLRIIKNRATGEETMGHKFDDFVAGYKKRGARYAWSNDVRGGKGENPTLDEFWNGTHAGFHVFKDRKSQEALIADLEQAGYVGLAYDGGKRVTGAGARGGGAVGQHHDVYILWDENAVNKFRVRDEAPIDAEVGDLEKGIRANQVMR